MSIPWRTGSDGQFGHPVLLKAIRIFALSNLVIAHPLYETISDSIAFFAPLTERSNLILFVATISFALPAALVLFEFLASKIHHGVGQSVHFTSIGFLTLCFFLQVFFRFTDHLWPLLLLSLLGSSVLLGIYYRFSWGGAYFTFLAPAIIVVPAYFLLDRGVSRIIWTTEMAVQERVSSAGTPVLMVVFDELPLSSLLDNELSLDERSFPSLAKLAKNATWYRNATTLSDYTDYALPAIFTGSHPRPERAPVWQDYPENLFTILGSTHEVHGREIVTKLCPPTVCKTEQNSNIPVRRLPGILADFAGLYLRIILPTSVLSRAEIRDQMQRDQPPSSTDSRASDFRSFVAGISRTDRAEFHSFHSLLPHVPYKYLPSGKLYALDSFSTGMLSDRDQRVADAWSVEQAYQRHLLQLGFVDSLVGELVHKLRAVDLFERSLLIVTADHGVSFLPGEPRRTLSEETYSDILQIPLLIKFPNQREGFVDERPVQTIDILPTICDVTNSPMPDSIAGQSLLKSDYVAQRSLKVISWRPRPEGTPLQLRIPGKSSIRASVSRKFRLFGNDRLSTFSIGPHPELIGRATDSLDFQDSLPIRARLDYPESFRSVAPAGLFLPALVSGQVFSRRRLETPLNLAIAVNGHIEATTQTSSLRDHRNGRWEAMIDEAALRPGSNEVEVFLIDDSDGVRMRPTSVTAIDPSRPRNHVLSSARVLWGVEQKGLHGQEWWSGQPVRWTDGAAELQIPLGFQQTMPRALRVVLASTGPPAGNQLVLELNGSALWSGKVPPGPWVHTFDRLPPLSEQLTLSIKSDTFSTSTDQRQLGVAISKIILLDDYQKLDPVILADAPYQYEIEPLGQLPHEIVIKSSAETIALRVANTGSYGWPTWEDLGTWQGAVRLGIQWVSVAPGPDSITKHRFDLPGAVLPGQNVVLYVPIQASTGDGKALPPGQYDVLMGLLQEGMAWFHQQGGEAIRLRVTVR